MWANWQEVEFYGVRWGLAGPQGVGMGQENFSHHAGWGQECNKIRPCGVRTKTLSFRPALPHCHLYASTTNTTTPIANESMTQRNGKGRYTREWHKGKHFLLWVTFFDFGKCFFVNHNFLCIQCQKNVENIIQNIFFVEAN